MFGKKIILKNSLSLINNLFLFLFIEVALVNDGEEVEIEDFGSSALEWLNEM